MMLVFTIYVCLNSVIFSILKSVLRHISCSSGVLNIFQVVKYDTTDI